MSEVARKTVLIPLADGSEELEVRIRYTVVLTHSSVLSLTFFVAQSWMSRWPQ